MYPGGLKEIPYRDMMKKKPDEVRAFLSVLTRHAQVIEETRTDHPACCFRHVAKKQAARTEIGKTSNIPWIPHGYSGGKHLEKLGRRKSAIALNINVILFHLCLACLEFFDVLFTRDTAIDTGNP
jgi:hypothetical protein